MMSSNPYKKYEEIFEEWPLVTASPVRGEHGLRVAGRHETPDNRKKTDNWMLASIFLWGAFIGGCYYTVYPDIKYNVQYDAELWAKIAVTSWVVLSGATFLWLATRPKKATAVLISPNHIQIGARVYDARVQHKFTMDLHRKAKEEAAAELRAQQRGKNKAFTGHLLRHYRDSYHIFLEYLGQRILVTDIYNEEHAEKLLRALMAADRIIHKEKTVFATKSDANVKIGTNTYESDIDESPGARAERRDYFGKRPILE